MILRAFAVSLLLVGCAAEAPTSKDDEIPVAAGEEKEDDNPSSPAAQSVKTCLVIEKQTVKDCTLYTLLCDDGSTEYAMTCQNRPWGHVTNTPRPISPTDHSMNL